MNRVEALVSQWQFQVTNNATVEANYVNKNKGTIYQHKRERIRNEVKRITTKLSNFGKGEINTWKVTLYDDKSIYHSLEINLTSDITEEEIRSYYESVHRCSVETISPRHHIKLGFNFPSS